MQKTFSYLIVFVLIIQTITAQDKKNLTYEQAFHYKGERLTKRLPSVDGWYDADSYKITKTDSVDKSRKLVSVDAKTGEEFEIANFTAINKNLPEGFNAERAIAVNDAYSGFLFNKDNDLYYYDGAIKEMLRITDDDEPENNPTLSPNGRMIVFTKGHNLYVYSLDIKSTFQLTKDGSDVILNGYSSWVYMEEILGRSTRHKAYWISPDNTQIAFLRFDDSEVPNFPIFDADGTHGSLEWERYPKAGDTNPKVKLAVFDIALSKLTWVDSTSLGENEYLAFPNWAPNSVDLFYQKMNREQNKLRIIKLNTHTLNSSLVYSETQPSWVNWIKDLTFLKNEDRFIVRSDKDGWWQLYLYDFNGSSITKLFNMKWNVTKILNVDEVQQKIYFEGTGEYSTDKQLFSVDLTGQNLIQITKERGTHSIKLSPTNYYFIDKFSSYNTPFQLSLYKTENGELIKKIGDAKSEAFDKYNLAKVELFSIPTDDGLNLPAKWYLPLNFDSNKKYPVIVSVYGGPNSKTVRNSWGYYVSPYYYASKGIIVLSVDHRGSGHFGKAETAKMYRQLGQVEMDDFIQVAKWLQKLNYVDASKIGISGYSYGGYVTCMALTYGADYFSYGIAGGSVIDWRLYDNIYTERYMDLPSENKAGYDKASVLTYVDKYKGKLLLVQGMMDDNVHMQNTIQLIDKLEDMNKPFELMFYANSRHGERFPKFYHSADLSADFWFRNYLGKTLSEVKEKD